MKTICCDVALMSIAFSSLCELVPDATSHRLHILPMAFIYIGSVVREYARITTQFILYTYGT